MRFIDSILNKISMYKLVLYELLFLLAAAMVLGVFHLVPYSPVFILYSAAIIFCIAWIANKIFAFCFDAPSNPESTYITALILALIITPPSVFVDLPYLMLAGWATSAAIASKYIFAFKEKHFFNPAAFGVAATALLLNESASWWVGTLWMLPFVFVGGFLVVRKIRRFDLIFSALGMFVVALIVLSLGQSVDMVLLLKESVVDAPLIFLVTVMLTEPFTTPPTRFLRMLYGAFVGFLLVPDVHFGSFYFTPELALLVGNIFAYVVSPKEKLLLTLKDRIQLSPDTYEFVFAGNRTLQFTPGQYIEWTLAHAKADARGIRRYFTIASAPSDPDFRIGVKFYEQSSSFKKALLAMHKGDRIVAAQLAGDFVLPQDKQKKIVFIAGGIGITPFRSMIQDLLDKKERRDITLIYSNKTVKDVAYVELLDQAESELGIETIPVFTSQTPEMLATNEFSSTVNQHLIMSSIPDYENRMYYLSGPRSMVDAFSDLLSQIGIPQSHIKKDFFPGFV